jgi:hypothetical protein
VPAMSQKRSACPERRSPSPAVSPPTEAFPKGKSRCAGGQVMEVGPRFVAPGSGWRGTPSVRMEPPSLVGSCIRSRGRLEWLRSAGDQAATTKRRVLVIPTHTRQSP